MMSTRSCIAACLTAVSLAASVAALAQSSPAPASPPGGAGQPAAAAAMAPAKPAVVNGHEIPNYLEDFLIRQHTQQQGVPDSPQLRSTVREELIKRELLLEEAEKNGFAKDPKVAEQLEFVRQNILLNAYVQDYFTKHPVSDADVKGEYDRLAKANSSNEYKASHILVKTEGEAKDVIVKLNKGAKFADLAKNSEDKGSKDNGGDLGWNTPSTFVKPFADAMVKLKKGETTQQPVQTQFGYHVIRLEDVRAAKAPPLDQVGPRIKQQMEQDQLEKLVSDLRSKSTIQ